jgi:hypothetical protein
VLLAVALIDWVGGQQRFLTHVRTLSHCMMLAFALLGWEQQQLLLRLDSLLQTASRKAVAACYIRAFTSGAFLLHVTHVLCGGSAALSVHSVLQAAAVMPVP